MGHLGEAGQDPDPAPAWDLMPRSAGPYGRVIATAGDLARPARMRLDGGVAQDGTRLLSEETVALMRRRVVGSPDKWTVSADGWGLGWTLYDGNGVQGFGHDGASRAARGRVPSGHAARRGEMLTPSRETAGEGRSACADRPKRPCGPGPGRRRAGAA